MGENKLTYNGYTIEKQTLIFKYKGKETEPITSYHIKQEKDGNIYFFRSARLESFKTAEQAKRAIKDKRIFCCAGMSL